LAHLWVPIIAIRGSNIFSPQNLPFKNMASITFFINFLMTHHVPLHNRGKFNLRSKIIGDPTFSCKLCGGMLGKSPGNKYCILKFNSLTSTFIAAKIALSASHSWFVYCLCTLGNNWSMRAFFANQWLCRNRSVIVCIPFHL
jgi:hypothetical protein